MFPKQPLIYLYDRDLAFADNVKQFLRIYPGLQFKVFQDNTSFETALAASPDLVFIASEQGECHDQLSKRIRSLRLHSDHTEAVILGGANDLRKTVTAIKSGASDFLVKDAEILEEIRKIISERLNRAEESRIYNSAFYKRTAIAAAFVAVISAVLFWIS